MNNDCGRCCFGGTCHLTEPEPDFAWPPHIIDGKYVGPVDCYH